MPLWWELIKFGNVIGQNENDGEDALEPNKQSMGDDVS